MIQHTENKPLTQLFSSDNQGSYFIPKYQREYIWKKFNWESLFDDIDESEGRHFLGSIICINTQTDSLSAPQLELVDGQQRMTTISLFYLAIYKYLDEKLPIGSEEDKYKLFSLKQRIVLENKNPRVTPSYSGHNLDDYNWIFYEVLDSSVNKPFEKPSYLGNRRMYKAFDYFWDRLNECDEYDQPIFNYEMVQKLLFKLNTSTIVKIDVSNHSDAFTLFETLNNRGVPLSAIDLIKNKLLGNLEKNNHGSIDRNFERWSKIVNNLTDEYSIQERFLRHFYNAFKIDKTIQVKRAPKAIKSNLIKIYDELINRDAELLLDNLEECSIIYNSNIEYDDHEHSNKLIYALQRLQNVNGADAYMLLMFLDKKFSISEDQKIELIDLLCKYFIRRNITDFPNTRNLTNYFIEIIEEIAQLDTYDCIQVNEIILRVGRPADESIFESKLKGDVYEDNDRATRYVLAMIERSKTETVERYTDFYARDKKLFVWTVEHIFPQGNNIPESWVNMIADGDKEKANNIRKEYVHKLGNLTLTGHNSQLGNMSFEKKKNRTKGGKEIGYMNGLFLNKEISNKTAWRLEDIKERTDYLTNLALNIFKF